MLLVCVVACGIAGCDGGSGGSAAQPATVNAPLPDGQGGSADGSPRRGGAREDGAGAETDPSDELPPALEPEEIFASPPAFVETNEVLALLLADLDGDADLDAVTSELDGVKLRGVAGASLSEAIVVRNVAASALAAGDLDGDADLDLVLGFLEEPVVVGITRGAADEVYFNDGAGGFVDSRQRLGRSFTRALALADLDLDGDLDLVTGAIGPNPVRLNDGFGSFGIDLQFLGDYRTVALALGDLDLDGTIDLITGNEQEVFTGGVVTGEPDRQWFFSLARGFTGALPLGDVRTVALALGDLDGDLDLDLITVSRVRGLLFLNDGAGNLLLAGPALESGAATTSLVAGDLDLDGDLDLVEGTESGARVWLNDGAAFFRASNVFLAPAVDTLALGDLDLDGDLDLVTAHDDGLRVWTNLSVVPVVEPRDESGDE